MNKFLLSSLLSVLFSIHAYCANNGESQTIEKIVTLDDSFNAIKASTGIKVEYIVTSDNEKPTAKLNVNSHIADYVAVEIKDKTLNVYYRNHENVTINTPGSPVLYLTAPSVDRVSVSSGASIYISGKPISEAGSVIFKASSGALIEAMNVCCGNFSLNSSSGSKITVGSAKVDNLNIEASSGSKTVVKDILSTNVHVSASSAANVKLSGKADNANINASSASNVSARNLICKTAYATSSSTAFADITADKSSISTSSQGEAKSYLP